MKKIKITLNSPVLLGFSALCLIATAAGIITGGKATSMLFMTRHTALTNPMTWIRFFTHILGHSNWQHFMGNITYILLLGPMLEEKYGSKRLLAVILITAFLTGIIHYFLFPSIALCGASGVVFAFILLTSFTGFRNGEIPITFLIIAVFFLGQQIFDAIFIRDNVSNLSHILGGLIGAAVGFQLNRKSY